MPQHPPRPGQKVQAPRPPVLQEVLNFKKSPSFKKSSPASLIMYLLQKMAQFLFPNLVEALDGEVADWGEEAALVPDGQGGFVDRALVETRRIYDRTNPLLHYRDFEFQRNFR